MRWIILLIISCFFVFTGCSDNNNTNDNNPIGDTDTGLEQGEDASTDSDAQDAETDDSDAQDAETDDSDAAEVSDTCAVGEMRCTDQNVEECVDGKAFELVQSCQTPETCIVKDSVASCVSCTSNDQCTPGFECSEGQCRKKDTELCPTAIAKARVATTTEYSHNSLSAKPLQTIDFSGLDSEGNGELTYEWTIIARPVGSKVNLSDNTIAEPELWLDLVGDYEIELNVFDADNTAACTTSTLKIHVVPEQEIYVQLTWFTLGAPHPTTDKGTDLDLHYRHPNSTKWNDKQYTVYWANKLSSPAWWGNTPTAENKAAMNIDDITGEMLENISHSQPLAGAYELGVHNYNDNGYGPADATIQIYIEGQLAFEIFDKSLKHKQFWRVGFVQWPEKTVDVIDQVVCDTTLDGFVAEGCRP